MPSFTASDGTVFTDRAQYRKYEFQLCYTFSDKSGERLVKQPGTIQGQPFDIADLKDCTVCTRPLFISSPTLYAAHV
jgi:hypothetical protein